MTQPEIDAYRKQIDELWDEQGYCRSCGWHGSVGDHDIEDWEIEWAVEHGGELELPCVNKSGEGLDHRGVRIYLKVAQTTADHGGKK